AADARGGSRAVHEACRSAGSADAAGRAVPRHRAGFRHQRVEDGVPDRLSGFHPLPHHRHGGGVGTDVDGHDDAFARADFTAVQTYAVRDGGRVESVARLADGELWIGAPRKPNMTPQTVLTIGQQALQMTLMIAGPLLLTALIVGLFVSVMQAATQINEMTLSFIPKLVGLFVMLIFAGPWMLTTMTEYMRRLFESIPFIIG